MERVHADRSIDPRKISFQSQRSGTMPRFESLLGLGLQSGDSTVLNDLGKSRRENKKIGSVIGRVLRRKCHRITDRDLSPSKVDWENDTAIIEIDSPGKRPSSRKKKSGTVVLKNSIATFEKVPKFPKESLLASHVRSRSSTLPTIVVNRRGASVTFGAIEIRQYPRELGDNPAVKSGPPLTVGWRFDPSTVLKMDIEAYEAEKSSNEKKQMVVPKFVREVWLMEAGYTRSEIAEAVRDIQAIKESRRRASIGHKKRRTRAKKSVSQMWKAHKLG